jgi:hypothetical protein
MNPKVVIPIVMLLAFIVLPLVFVLIQSIYKTRARKRTQRTISDPDLLRFIHNEPDRMASPHILSAKTGLSLNEARSRFGELMMYGILNRNIGGSRHYFSLKEPLPEDKNLQLSSDPFLTVEDLLVIFEAYSGRVSAQDLIMATGLPLGILKREMKHFEKQGITRSMRGYAANGLVMQRFFILEEPYRSNPEQFRTKADQLDLEIKKILVDEKYLV